MHELLFKSRFHTLGFVAAVMFVVWLLIGDNGNGGALTRVTALVGARGNGGAVPSSSPVFNRTQNDIVRPTLFDGPPPGAPVPPPGVPMPPPEMVGTVPDADLIDDARGYEPSGQSAAPMTDGRELEPRGSGPLPEGM